MTHGKDAESMKTRLGVIPEGSHVHLLAHGQRIGSGVIDTWMPDGSAFWIWLDHGAGKRLIHESDGVDALVSAGDPEIRLPQACLTMQRPVPTGSGQ